MPGSCGPGASDDQVELIRRRQFPLVGAATGHSSWVHLDDAAGATVLAVELGVTGVFNIVDDEPAPAGDVAENMMTEGRGFYNAKAKHELGWKLIHPSWREDFKKGLM